LNKPKVYLDAEGDVNAQFILNVLCWQRNRASQRRYVADNVFWIIGASLTMDAISILMGNVLTGSAITVGTNAKIAGRAIEQSAVTCETGCTIEKRDRRYKHQTNQIICKIT
jgi:hypothetical protein